MLYFGRWRGVLIKQNRFFSTQTFSSDRRGQRYGLGVGVVLKAGQPVATLNVGPRTAPFERHVSECGLVHERVPGSGPIKHARVAVFKVEQTATWINI